MATKKIPTSLAVKKEFRSLLNTNVDIPGLITNEKIRSTFIDILSRSSMIPGSAMNHIWRLVQRQVIVPVNVDEKYRSKVKMVSDKANQQVSTIVWSKGTMGFFSGSKNRIYMLLDNILNRTQDPNAIATILVHELQHMQCYNYPNQFYFVHRDVFIKFYSEFFKRASYLVDPSVPAVINTDVVGEVVRYMMYMFDDLLGGGIFPYNEGDFKMLGRKIIWCYKNYEDYKDHFQRVTSIISYGAFTITDGAYFNGFNTANRSDSRYVMFKSIEYAYETIAGSSKVSRSDTFFGQEMLFPSEVLSVLVSFGWTKGIFAFLPQL